MNQESKESSYGYDFMMFTSFVISVMLMSAAIAVRVCERRAAKAGLSDVQREEVRALVNEAMKGSETNGVDRQIKPEE